MTKPSANQIALTVTWKRIDGRPCGRDSIAEALETELDGFSFDVETPDGKDMSVYEIEVQAGAAVPYGL